MADEVVTPVEWTPEMRAEQARLRELVDRVGGPSEAAKIAGVSRNTIYQWLNYKTMIPLPAAAGLAASVTPPLSLDWLVTGDSRPEIRTDGGFPPDGFVAIPRLEVRASAGPGRAVTPVDFDSEPQIAFREAWLRSLGVAPRHAEFVQAEGDSMYPTICDGDLMLVDRGYGQVANGKIYVLVVDGLVLVKRLQLLAVGGLMLISDNDRYPTETIPANDVAGLSIEARVAWYGRAI